jgi:hypothetical protein
MTVLQNVMACDLLYTQRGKCVVVCINDKFILRKIEDQEALSHPSIYFSGEGGQTFCAFGCTKFRDSTGVV